MIKVGDQVLTSKGRYGRVIQIQETDNVKKCLVKIGSNSHWILEDQLVIPSHCIRVKTVYEIEYCGKTIEDSIEVSIKKDTTLFDNNTSYLETICKEHIKNQIGIYPKIKQIKIS